MHARYVPYLRTSTVQQVFGIKAQRETVYRLVSQRSGKIHQEFLEHETGQACDRPELLRAIRCCRAVGGTLVVAKLDRLARNARFLNELVDGKVPIVFCDLPEVDGSAASMLAVKMMAVVAEFEVKRQGERMRDCFRVMKAQGRSLGTPGNLTEAARRLGTASSARSRRIRALDLSSFTIELLEPFLATGKTWAEMAGYLNGIDHPTTRGGRWTAARVLVVARLHGIVKTGYRKPACKV